MDYIGVCQGVPICFDAKECSKDVFSLQNIHDHQLEFMENFEKQEGIAFLIILFTHRNEFYYMRYSEIKGYVDRVKDGHAKNFRYDELSKDWFIKGKNGAMVHYLKCLSRDLLSR